MRPGTQALSHHTCVATTRPDHNQVHHPVVPKLAAAVSASKAHSLHGAFEESKASPHVNEHALWPQQCYRQSNTQPNCGTFIPRGGAAAAVRASSCC